MSNRIAKIVEMLNAYQGVNIWADLIKGLPDFDEDNTMVLDPHFHGEAFATVTGEFCIDGFGCWNGREV